MRKLLFLCMALVSVVTFWAVAGQAASAAALSAKNERIAVLPYFNASAEKKDYVEETVTAGYTNYFKNAGYTLINDAVVAQALSQTGYTTEDEELPDKDQMKAVASATKADYVVAMEISELHASRHISFFQEKVTAKTKLSYRIYSVKADRVYSFKTTSSSDNKTVFGGVGFKAPIVNALNDAMEKGIVKLQSFMTETREGNVSQ